MKRNIDHGKYLNEAGHLTQEALGWLREGPMPSQVKKHLGGCELCRDALEGFSEGGESMPHTEMIRSMRHQLDQKTFRGMHLARARRRLRRTAYWPVYLAAAASVLALVGYFAFLPGFRQPASHIMADRPQTEREEKVLTPIHPAEEKIVGEEARKTAERTSAPAMEPEMPPLAAEEDLQAEIMTREILAEASTEAFIDIDDILSETEGVDGLVAAADKTEPEIQATGKAAPAAAKKAEARTTASHQVRRTMQDTLSFLIGNASIVSPTEDAPALLAREGITLPVFSYPDYEHFFDYIYSTMNMPVRARRKWVSGTVYVGFTIDENGSVSNVKVLHGIDPTVDEEALRVISLSPAWNPGTINGRPTPAYVRVPVRFNE